MSTPPRARILVTGGAGFIGSHIVNALDRQGVRALVLDDLSTGNVERLAAGAEIEHADIADAHFDLEALLGKWLPETIVHCAAQTSVSRSLRDPVRDAQINIIGSVRLIDAARKHGAARFVYVTTGGALYGLPRYLPCDEGHPIEPVSPYGQSKWAAEGYLRILAPSLVRIVLRLGNVYGPWQNATGEAGVVAIFANRMIRGQAIEIHGDGQQTRDFVYVIDVVEAVLQSLRSSESITANLGSGVATSVNELFERIARLTNYRRQPIVTPSRAGDVHDSVLATDEARLRMGWSALTPLDEGLLETIRWHARNIERVG
jgi:UDP-glucose 4-epimerase